MNLSVGLAVIDKYMQKRVKFYVINFIRLKIKSKVDNRYVIIIIIFISQLLLNVYLKV